MIRKTRPYREALLAGLQDPKEAANYLNAALEDSPEMFRKACLNVIQAHQVSKVARKSGVTRENLYRSFSAAGNPTLETLHSVLQALNLHLGVQPRLGEAAGLARKTVPAKRARRQETPRRRRAVPA